MVSEQSDNLKDEKEEGWSRQLVSKLAFAALIEQRRRRRWGIFFKLLFFVYLVALLLAIYIPIEDKAMLGKRHTALVKLDGLIASSTEANADNFIAGLRAALENDNTAGVILEINSPGGSPVQAGQMFDEILRLRSVHPNIPVFAVVSDVCASGGYYVAAAAQKIFANRASIIGSIGVRADGFGFVAAMEKLGIERRLFTAGEHKSFLDPFSPSQPQDVEHLQSMLADIHQQFITAVRKGRGDRLRETPELFSGLVWTGQQGLELGLVDDLADLHQVAEQLVGAKLVVDYTRRTRLVERIFDAAGSALYRSLLRWTGLDVAAMLR